MCPFSVYSILVADVAEFYSYHIPIASPAPRLRLFWIDTPSIHPCWSLGLPYTIRSATSLMPGRAKFGAGPKESPWLAEQCGLFTGCRADDETGL
jgi:hypothetical protein